MKKMINLIDQDNNLEHQIIKDEITSIIHNYIDSLPQYVFILGRLHPSNSR